MSNIRVSSAEVVSYEDARIKKAELEATGLKVKIKRRGTDRVTTGFSVVGYKNDDSANTEEGTGEAEEVRNNDNKRSHKTGHTKRKSR